MGLVCFYDGMLVVEEVTQKVTLNMVCFWFFLVFFVLGDGEELLQA